MTDSEVESPPQSTAQNSVTRGIASLFLWNQVLVIASLFLAMLGVSSLLQEATVAGITVSVFLLLLSLPRVPP